MEGSKVFNKAYLFEQIVKKILSRHYNLIEGYKDAHSCYDLNVNGTCVEIKYYIKNKPFDFLNDIKNAFSHNENISNIVFVSNITNYSELSEENIKANIMTFENLLYFCEDDENLKSELLSVIDFSTEKVVGKKPSDKILNLLSSPNKKSINRHEKVRKYKERLEGIQPGRSSFRKYEVFCFEFVKNIFARNIDRPISQKQNNNTLYKFDIIASLKKDPESFWRFIYDKYNSCFILFECKNYEDKITQGEIYTTEKYLYNNALRNVAIIFSRKGADRNANIAAQGILKESGKLILILDDNDVINMCELYFEEIKGNNQYTASDYLMDKAKEFLLNLDK